MGRYSALLTPTLLLALGAWAAAAISHQPAALHVESGPACDAPPVDIVLYAEALCPYCAAFVNNTMGPLLSDPQFAEAINFRVVYYGNAVNRTRGGVACQHGPAECRLNRVVNCATALYPAHWLPFLVCLEAAPAKKAEAAVAGCAAGAGMDVAALKQCAGGPLGDELERAAAKETAALDPPHQYVPWVVARGVPLGDQFEDVWRYVCVAYRGVRPKACYAPPQTAAATAAAEGQPAAAGAVAGGAAVGAGAGGMGSVGKCLRRSSGDREQL